jgi:hypothetical protein
LKDNILFLVILDSILDLIFNNQFLVPQLVLIQNFDLLSWHADYLRNIFFLILGFDLGCGHSVFIIRLIKLNVNRELFSDLLENLIESPKMIRLSGKALERRSIYLVHLQQFLGLRLSIAIRS